VKPDSCRVIGNEIRVFHEQQVFSWIGMSLTQV